MDIALISSLSLSILLLVYLLIVMIFPEKF
jgi:K+-transporting ATPase KdpF subunit